MQYSWSAGIPPKRDGSVPSAVAYGWSAGPPTQIVSGGSTLLPMSGDFGAVAGVFGSTSKKIQTTGLIDTSVDISGVAVIKKNVAGSMNGTSDLTGQIRIIKSLSGSIDTQAGISGLISIKRALSRDLHCIADISADISVLKKLIGAVGSEVDIQGSVIINGINKIRLSGSIKSMSAIEAAINVKKSLIGQIQAIPHPDGRISVRVDLTGSVDTIAAAIGDLRIVGAGTLGIVIDPSIDSVSVKRLLIQVSKKYTIESI